MRATIAAKLQCMHTDVDALPDMVPSSASELAASRAPWLAASDQMPVTTVYPIVKCYGCALLTLVPAMRPGCCVRQSLIPVHTYKLQPLASVPLALIQCAVNRFK